jgi:MFS transporter, MHS family, proline/betaine transporter
MVASTDAILAGAGNRVASGGTAKRAVVAGTIGHVLEWYDFAVYGYVATAIAANFFPSTDDTASLLASFATFGVGFVARPFGGFLFGRIGDVRGRKAVLLQTMLLMAISTVAIGLLPSYSTLGIAAPIILVLARLAQGFSAGGETTGAAAFIVEWAPTNRRGFFGSFQQVGSATGLLLGGLAAAILTSLMSAEDVRQWGWRIPFLVGGLLGPIGFLIRRTVDETPVFTHVAAAPQTDETKLPPGMLARFVTKAFLFTMFWSVSFYFFLSYMPTFAQRELKIPGSQTFWINTLSTACYIVMIPMFGALSDKIGRKPVVIGSCVGFAVLLQPMFSLLTSSTPSIGLFAATVLVFSVFLAMYTGPAAATLSEIFPTRYRSSGMAVGYSISTVVFGGFTPFIATWLISVFGTPLAPIYYVIVCAVAGAVALLTFRETSRGALS